MPTQCFLLLRERLFYLHYKIESFLPVCKNPNIYTVESITKVLLSLSMRNENPIQVK